MDVPVSKIKTDWLRRAVIMVTLPILVIGAILWHVLRVAFWIPVIAVQEAGRQIWSGSCKITSKLYSTAKAQW